jgi:hypothetical protein
MIQQTLQAATLLAVDEDAFRVWGRFDHEKPEFGAGHLMTLAGITALLLLAAMVWRICRRRSTTTFATDSPWQLFRELCAAHGLNRHSRRLLRQLAAARGLASAATLFVEPRHFETKNLPAELKPSTAELTELRAKLFG